MAPKTEFDRELRRIARDLPVSREGRPELADGRPVNLLDAVVEKRLEIAADPRRGWRPEHRTVE